MEVVIIRGRPHLVCGLVVFDLPTSAASSSPCWPKKRGPSPQPVLQQEGVERGRSACSGSRLRPSRRSFEVGLFDVHHARSRTPDHIKVRTSTSFGKGPNG